MAEPHHRLLPPVPSLQEPQGWPSHAKDMVHLKWLATMFLYGFECAAAEGPTTLLPTMRRLLPRLNRIHAAWHSVHSMSAQSTPRHQRALPQVPAPVPTATRPTSPAPSFIDDEPPSRTRARSRIFVTSWTGIYRPPYVAPPRRRRIIGFCRHKALLRRPKTMVPAPPPGPPRLRGCRPHGNTRARPQRRSSLRSRSTRSTGTSCPG